MANRLPISTSYTPGLEDYCRTFQGFAESQMNILENQMSFRSLEQGSRQVRPVDGVKIDCTVNNNIRQIKISVTDEPLEAETGEWEVFVEEADLRFFIRVGMPDDILYDGVGFVIGDSTRYYWFDFKYGPGENELHFWYPGEIVSEVIDELEKKAYYIVAPFLDPVVRLQVATLPFYTYQEYVRSFEMTDRHAEEQSDGEEFWTQRLVAGYHYVSYNRMFAVHPQNTIFPPSGPHLVDPLRGVTMEPQNRMHYNKDDRSLVWYHATQMWGGDESTCAVTSRATGCLTGKFFKLKVAMIQDELTGVWFEGWTHESYNSFSVNGFDSTGFGYGESIVGLCMYEPVGVQADIVFFDKGRAVMHIPYQHQLYEFEYRASGDGEETTYSLYSCDEIPSDPDGFNEKAKGMKFEVDGLVLYNTAQCYDQHGSGSTIIVADKDETTVFNWIGEAEEYPPCGEIEDVDCYDADLYMHRYEKTRYEKTVSDSPPNWTDINIFTMSGTKYSFQKYDGSHPETYAWEMNIVGECCGCVVPITSHCSIACVTRSMTSRNSLSVSSGALGTIVDMSVPCQNVTITNSIEKRTENISISAFASFGGACPADTPFCGDSWNPRFSSDDCKTDFGYLISCANDGEPLNFGTGYFGENHTGWPTDYEFINPLDDFEDLGVFPFELPSLEFYRYIFGTIQWKTPDNWVSNETSTEVLNELDIDVPGVHTLPADEVLKMRILDDRDSVDSQGIMTAIQMFPEHLPHKVYHDGTEIYADIIDKMVEQGIFNTETDMVHDFGLL